MDISDREKEIINFLKELVRTPSQNGIDSERRVADLVFKKLAQFGFSPKIIGTKKHPSVFCKIINRASSGKTIWFESCLDTVPVGDLSKWKFPPLKGIIKGSRIYGRGVADSKIGIAIFCYLAKELYNNPKFKGNIILGFDSNEQSGEFTGIRDILKQKPRADICVLGYQGVDEISIGARGWLRLKITTKGKSAHTGSKSKRGVNAIHQMSGVIAVLKGLDFGGKKEPYFEYGSSFNVSLIQGGIAINIVPDECEAKIEIRFLPSQNIEEILDKIHEQLRKLRQRPQFSYKIEVLQSENAFLTNPENRFVKLLRKIAQEELKRKIPLVSSGGGSVGNVISKFGIPVINSFGCKCDNVHAPNEWVNLETLPKAFEIYKKTILEFSSGSN